MAITYPPGPADWTFGVSLARGLKYRLIETYEKLHRDYEFADFRAAMGYMVEVALHVERMDHHPEWFNVYNKVVVDLTTHDAGGVSARDIELASVMERLAAQRAK